MYPVIWKIPVDGSSEEIPAIKFELVIAYESLQYDGLNISV